MDGDAGGGARRRARHVRRGDAGVRPQPAVADGGAAHRARRARCRRWRRTASHRASAGTTRRLPQAARRVRHARRRRVQLQPDLRPGHGLCRPPGRGARRRRSASWACVPRSCRDGSTARPRAIIDAPWAIAVGADFLHPKTVGPEGAGDGPGQPLHAARRSRARTPRSHSRGRSTSCSTWSRRPAHWRGRRSWPGCWRRHWSDVAGSPRWVILGSGCLVRPRSVRRA